MSLILARVVWALTNVWWKMKNIYNNPKPRGALMKNGDGRPALKLRIPELRCEKKKAPPYGAINLFIWTACQNQWSRKHYIHIIRATLTGTCANGPSHLYKRPLGTEKEGRKKKKRTNINIPKQGSGRTRKFWSLPFFWCFFFWWRHFHDWQ